MVQLRFPVYLKDTCALLQAPAVAAVKDRLHTGETHTAEARAAFCTDTAIKGSRTNQALSEVKTFPPCPFDPSDRYSLYACRWTEGKVLIQQ